jgi:hypothetical protein
MNDNRRWLLLGLALILLAGCRDIRRRTDYWKTTPDIYKIDCNVPYAKVEVYDRSGDLVSTVLAGEHFEDFHESWTIKVIANGYYTYSGPVSDLEVVGKKSWYVKLRKKHPGDMGGE